MVEYISKFGVPTGGSTGRGGFLMPKLKYRFRVRFINFGPVSGGLELTQQVMRVDKPKVSWEEVTMDAYNSRAYVLGKHSWETISCTLRDDATNVVSKIVGHQFRNRPTIWNRLHMRLVKTINSTCTSKRWTVVMMLSSNNGSLKTAW